MHEISHIWINGNSCVRSMFNNKFSFLFFLFSVLLTEAILLFDFISLSFYLSLFYLYFFPFLVSVFSKHMNTRDWIFPPMILKILELVYLKLSFQDHELFWLSAFWSHIIWQQLPALYWIFLLFTFFSFSISILELVCHTL